MASKLMYHASPTVERSEIMQNGLIPNQPEHPLKFPEGVYLFASVENALFFAETMEEQEQEEYGDEASDYDVWEVNTNGLTLLSDPAVSDDDPYQREYPTQPLESYYTTQVISSDRLNLTMQRVYIGPPARKRWVVATCGRSNLHG